jgi:hypothetical protein
LPGGCAAHAEADIDQAVFIDGVALLHVFEGFEEVDFAGELVGVAIATVEVDGEVSLGSEFFGAEELELHQFFASAVAPEVEAVFGGLVVGFVSFGDDEDVRLNGAIDAGDVTARAGEVNPFGLAGAELGEAGVGVGEGGAGGFGVDQFVIDQRIADGVVIDLDVGEEGEEGGLVFELEAKRVDSLA